MAQPGPSPVELPDDYREGTLFHLLTNHLILCHTTPLLPVTAIVNLAATSRSFRALIYGAPQVFRHLDLSELKRAQFEIAPIDHGGQTWRNVQMDENLTEDDFYSGPLRGIFSTLGRANILAQVQTLILDGLAVTAVLVHDILRDPSYNVRILSLRNATHLNERLLCHALRTACRASRPEGTPKLKGLYIFSPRQEPPGPTQGERTPQQQEDWLSEPWYVRRGEMPAQQRAAGTEWATTLLACRGIIAFDAVLCNGPAHHNSPAFGTVPGGAGAPNGAAPFAVATHSVGGCAGCGGAPEGWTTWGEPAHGDGDGDGDMGRFPLLSPPPLLSSNVRAAMCPAGQNVHPGRFDVLRGAGDRTARARFVARCLECLRDRYCRSCRRWWCEACFPGLGGRPVGLEGDGDVHKAGVSTSCWGCGKNCHACIVTTQRMCRNCCGGYCLIHNEGSTMSMCDWCSGRGRRIRELY